MGVADLASGRAERRFRDGSWGVAAVASFPLETTLDKRETKDALAVLEPGDRRHQALWRVAAIQAPQACLRTTDWPRNRLVPHKRSLVVSILTLVLRAMIPKRSRARPERHGPRRRCLGHCARTTVAVAGLIAFYAGHLYLECVWPDGSGAQPDYGTSGAFLPPTTPQQGTAHNPCGVARATSSSWDSKRHLD